jgi:hypothetical protein
LSVVAGLVKEVEEDRRKNDWRCTERGYRKFSPENAVKREALAKIVPVANAPGVTTDTNDVDAMASPVLRLPNATAATASAGTVRSGWSSRGKIARLRANAVKTIPGKASSRTGSQAGWGFSIILARTALGGREAARRTACRRSTAANRGRRLAEQRLDPDEDECRRRQRCEQDEPGHLHPRRHARELEFEELDFVGDRVRLGADRVDLAQRERVFSSHEHVLAEDG